ncbi:TonB family protein [Hymenobacter bucti]|uniref:TonB family protein n=1 Tax=Hymenobacter bucti TaxID=1844114 RepID=A0ABW4QTA9_9BACT
MRYLSLLLLAGARVACGQTQADTLVVAALPQQAEEIQRRVASRTDSTGRCYETLSWTDGQGLVRIYYASGRLKEYVPYADLGTGQVYGLATTWYESGQLESRQPFLGGKRTGKLELYYATGQLKRRTEYDAGAELPGQCFDAAGRSVAYFPYEQLPLYPGGQGQLAKEISSALRWPRDVPPLPGQRIVGISFLVDEDGSIQDPRVAVSSQSPSLDRAVLATIAKLTRRFTPARRDGRVVQSSYYLPIQFGGTAYNARPEKI